MDWDGTHLGGFWGIASPISRTEDGEFLSSYVIGDHTIDSFWPLAYVFNESSLSGNWVFTGSRDVKQKKKEEVPDAGSTAALLGLSVALLIFAQRKAAIVLSSWGDTRK
jgi:hypothetical protein